MVGTVEDAAMNDNGEAPHLEIRFRRLMPVGEGEARGVYARLLGEGFDAVLAGAVVYNVAEGFSRASGEPDGDPMRFHEGIRRGVGAPLPDGLDADTLMERSRDAMTDPNLLDALLYEEIEEIALTIGADILRESAPRI
jgi:hypothetical protein